MTEEKMNRKFEYDISEIEDKIGVKLNGDISGYKTVVSPREIIDVENLSIMESRALEGMIRNIPLRGHPDVYPYKNSGIKVFEREPHGHEIGQTFIHSIKLLTIMENIKKNFLERFDAPGLSSMPGMKIYGRDKDEKKVVAFYVPPLLEIHGDKVVLIDGIHRSYIARSAGTTQRAVHIVRVGAPLPFDPIDWKEAIVMKEKPPVELRYRNLRREYFRDLGAIGIDG